MKVFLIFFLLLFLNSCESNQHSYEIETIESEFSEPVSKKVLEDKFNKLKNIIIRDNTPIVANKLITSETHLSQKSFDFYKGIFKQITYYSEFKSDCSKSSCDLAILVANSEEDIKGLLILFTNTKDGPKVNNLSLILHDSFDSFIQRYGFKP